MTYYKIKKYLTQCGLTGGQADRVRSMIREMIKDAVADIRMEKHYGVEMVGHHRVSHNGPCPEGCYYETIRCKAKRYK